MFIEKAQVSRFGKASNLSTRDSRGERVNRRPGSESGNGKGYFERKKAQRNLALENFRSASRAGEFARPK